MGLMQEKIVVLAVDIDDDVSKSGVKTPIFGRENVLDAATKLALITPEDTDVNALFGAIKQLDLLKSQGVENAEIAVVSGSVKGGVEADLNIRREVLEVKERLNPSGVVFVSDGGDDERVIPIIQSLLPLFSVQRVTVQYSKGIEENYRVLASYIRKGLTEPRFIKYTLGIPGLLIIASTALAIAGLSAYVYYAFYAIGLVIGIIMTIRGFNVPEVIGEEWEKQPIYFIGRVVSLIVLVVAVFTDVEIVLSHVNPAESVSLVIKGTFDYYVLALIVYFSSIVATTYLEGAPRFWKEVTGATLLLSLRPAVFYILTNLIGGTVTIGAVEGFLILMFSATLLTILMAVLSLRLEKWVNTRFFSGQAQASNPETGTGGQV
jgi:putative membrane protein